MGEEVDEALEVENRVLVSTREGRLKFFRDTDEKMCRGKEVWE